MKPELNPHKPAAAPEQYCLNQSRSYRNGLRVRSAGFGRSWSWSRIAGLAAPLASRWQLPFCSKAFTFSDSLGS
jgi:hypothetical protein